MNDEAESKEAQELFFELGYKKGACPLGGYPAVIVAVEKVIWHKGPVSARAIDNEHSAHKDYRELTLPQLRDMVAAHRKPTEEGLISGADALRALADGETVEVKRIHDSEWLPAQIFGVSVFTNSETTSFRLKPRTIKLEIEIPACGTNYKHGQLIWILNSLEPKEYCSVILDESDELPAYWWKSEEEIKQVVAALRGGIKG